MTTRRVRLALQHGAIGIAVGVGVGAVDPLLGIGRGLDQRHFLGGALALVIIDPG